MPGFFFDVRCDCKSVNLRCAQIILVFSIFSTQASATALPPATSKATLIAASNVKTTVSSIDSKSYSSKFRPLCREHKLIEICQIATRKTPSVDISCSIDFARQDCKSVGFTENIITKKLLFRGSSASNISADFGGAIIQTTSDSTSEVSLDTSQSKRSVDVPTVALNASHTDLIEVHSKRSPSGQWLVPANITIRNATIYGSIRIFGMGRNSENDEIRKSSAQVNHVRRLRDAAPYDVHLENLSIIGQGRNLVYFGPGVQRSSLKHSSLDGFSRRVGVYLDAETSEIHIDHNHFDVDTVDGSWWGFYDRGWPQIAIDGSSHNKITHNTFKQLDNGGVYLYRNCGEGGTIRYGTPSHNTISNNLFELPQSSFYQIPSPAVYLGSRNYGTLENIVPGSHCNEDQQHGLRAGSALSNADFASHNKVMFNKFVLSPAADLKQRQAQREAIIQVGNTRADKNNEVRGNQWFWH